MHIERERITFSFKTSSNALIRITPSAWIPMFGGQPRCVIVTITIQEDTVASTPPSYASAKNDPLLSAVASRYRVDSVDEHQEVTKYVGKAVSIL